MSDTPTDVAALATRMRGIGIEGHNALRRERGLPLHNFPTWDEIPVDQRAAWRAVASYVIENYTFKHVDPDALVKAAASKIYPEVCIVLDPEQCSDLARKVLSVAGLVPEKAKS